MSKLSAEALDYFRQQGKKGGKIGGERAAANMTPAQRKARATKASQAAAVARMKKNAKIAGIDVVTSAEARPKKKQAKG
jgi:hypothetical protein